MDKTRTARAPFQSGLQKGLGIGLGIGVGLLSTALFAAAAAMNVFAPGEVISSNDLNKNFEMAAPEGAVMAFYLPDCPDGWARGNGSNGTPDLRGRFIRGMNESGAGADPDTWRVSGSIQTDAFQGHWHETWHNTSEGGTGVTGDDFGFAPTIKVADVNSRSRSAITDGSHGDPRIAAETRPVNVALIYCMRQN